MTPPRVLTVDPVRVRPSDLASAADWLRTGGVVAYPTDTFYGLAVDPSSRGAVQALFDLKGRGKTAAVPLIAASFEQVRGFCPSLSPQTVALATAFWPGPLSLLCDAPSAIDPAVHAGHHSVAMRVPDHAVARALALAWGSALTATSANASGEPPAQSATDLGRLARDARVMVVDAGRTPGGVPSTIVDARVSPARLIRAGAIAWDRVLRSLDP